MVAFPRKDDRKGTSGASLYFLNAEKEVINEAEQMRTCVVYRRLSESSLRTIGD
jgi:hypothetical protein